MTSSSGSDAAPPAGSPEPPPLLHRVLRAGSWAVGLRGFEKLLGLARITLLARLLSPDDFGMFGIAMLALSLVEALSKTGFDAALIQRKHDVRPYLSTAWTLQLIRGLFLAAILFAAAPLVTAFFAEPEATRLLRVLSLNAVLIGATNIGVTVFSKELRFDKVFAFHLSGTLVDLAISVWAAFVLRNAWALVYGLLAGNLVRFVVSHLVAPRVRFEIDRARARPLLRFGRWVWGASIASYALIEGDDIFVGKVLGTDALGLYRLAYVYGNLPATEINHVVSTVSFPAYSLLQNDPDRLREAFIRTLRVTLFVAAPAAVGIILVAPGFVRLFLGTPANNPWLPMIVPLQILAVWGLIRSLGGCAGALIQGAGRPDVLTKLIYARLLVLATIIYPLTMRWGLAGAAGAVVVSAVVINPFTDAAAIRLSGCGTPAFVGAVAYPLAGSGLMALAVIGVQRLLGPGYGIGGFALSILAGVVAYAGAYLLLRATFGYDVGSAFRRS